MKTNEELHQLYETELKPGLQELESNRKKIRNNYGLFVLIIIIAFALTALFGEQFHASIFIAIAVIGFSGFMIYKNYLKHKAYRIDFKQIVVKRIVEMINPEWDYKADGRISEHDYRASTIYTQSYDRYKGDDYVKGKIEKTDFEFSELHTEYKTYTTKDGKTEEQWHTIFKGLFAHADFNKEIKGRTLVLPDTAEKMFGSLGTKMQKASGRGKLIKMENPEFEKEFVVYGSDQIESRYVITPGMMEAMLKIKKQYNKTVSFAFIGSRVYVAMYFSKDLFEPRLLKSGVQFKDVEQMASQFSLIEALIHEMNLNTRIWTKD
jgi:hypothetical protein